MRELNTYTKLVLC